MFDDPNCFHSSVDSARIDLSKLSVENAEVADAEVMTTATREDALVGEEYSTLRFEGTNVAANAEVDVSETEKVAYLCNRLSSILRVFFLVLPVVLPLY